MRLIELGDEPGGREQILNRLQLLRGDLPVWAEERHARADRDGDVRHDAHDGPVPQRGAELFEAPAGRHGDEHDAVPPRVEHGADLPDHVREHLGLHGKEQHLGLLRDAPVIQHGAAELLCESARLLRAAV